MLEGFHSLPRPPAESSGPAFDGATTYQPDLHHSHIRLGLSPTRRKACNAHAHGVQVREPVPSGFQAAGLQSITGGEGPHSGTPRRRTDWRARPAAVRDAQVGGAVVPRPAAHHPEARALLAVLRVFEQRFRLLIKLLIVPICHPFLDVPAHVVEAIAIRGIRTYWRRGGIPVIGLDIPPGQVTVLITVVCFRPIKRRIAKRPGIPFGTRCGLFPLGLGGKPLTHILAVGSSFLPIDTHHWFGILPEIVFTLTFSHPLGVYR